MDTTERIRTLTDFPPVDGDGGINFRSALEQLSIALANYSEVGLATEDLGVALDRSIVDYIEATEALADEIIPALADDTAAGIDDAADRLDALFALDVKVASLVSQLSAEIEVERFDAVPELSSALAVELHSHAVGREGFEFVLPLVAGVATIRELRPPDDEPVLVSGGADASVRSDVDAILEVTMHDAFVTTKRSTTLAGSALLSVVQRLVEAPDAIRADLDGIIGDLRDALGWLARGAARVWRAAAKKIAALIAKDGVGRDLATFIRTVDEAVAESEAGGHLLEELSDEARRSIRDRLGAELLGADAVVARCDAALAVGDATHLLGEAHIVVDSFRKRRRFIRWGNLGVVAMSTAAYAVPPMMAPALVAAAIVLAGNYWKAHDHLDSHSVGVLTALPDRNKGLIRSLDA